MSPVKRILISGMVQGVGFRYSMMDAAKNSGITGWVRNRRDGSVEALVQGTPEQVQSIIEWAKRGPPFSQVNEVRVAEGEGIFTDFKIESTC